MARAEIGETVASRSGRPISGASVQVNRRAGTAATVYASETGTTTVSNPLTTDSYGRIEGWLNEGSYDLSVTANGSSYTQRFEAIKGAVGGSTTITVTDAAYGAKGDGVTDDTAAINAAEVARSAVNGILYFPTGSYVYNGTGIDATQPRVRGAGAGATTIVLGAASRFINTTTAISRMDVRGIRFTGGTDVIRSPFTGDNSIFPLVVEDCEFSGYTKAAISFNSSNLPFVRINRCVFYAANVTTSMGVALSGLADGCEITQCDFGSNRVHVKLRHGGPNAHMRGNMFFQTGASAGSPRVDLWVVPLAATNVNAGQGFYVEPSTRFGNENRETTDYYVLYADEDTAAGTDNGTYFPKVSADSTGYIAGHHIAGSFFGTGTEAVSLVYSTTPNILGSRYDLFLSGTVEYLIKFRTAPTADRLNTDNIVSFFAPLTATEDTVGPRISNGVGAFRLIDPAGILDTRPNERLSYHGTTDPTDSARLLPTGIRAFTVSSATLTNTTDVFGGIDASELNFTAANGIVYTQLTMGSVVAGQPVWIEFDAKVGAATALTKVQMTIFTEGGALHLRRMIEIPSAWRRFRILYVPRTAAGQTDIQFNTNLVETGKVKIGRVRVYHNREPQNDGAYPIAQGVNRILSGSGVPDAGLGANGDFYFRIDTPGTGNQRLYVRSAGTWTGIL